MAKMKSKRIDIVVTVLLVIMIMDICGVIAEAARARGWKHLLPEKAPNYNAKYVMQTSSPENLRTVGPDSSSILIPVTQKVSTRAASYT